MNEPLEFSDDELLCLLSFLNDMCDIHGAGTSIVRNNGGGDVRRVPLRRYTGKLIKEGIRRGIVVVPACYTGETL